MNSNFSIANRCMTRISGIVLSIISAVTMIGITPAYAGLDSLEATFGKEGITAATEAFDNVASQPLTNIIVTTSIDELNAKGDCSLREAIINANNDDQSGSTDCAAGSGADIITFNIRNTIMLSSTLPSITSDITLDGTGNIAKSVAISGNDAVRVFAVAATGHLRFGYLQDCGRRPASYRAT